MTRLNIILIASLALIATHTATYWTGRTNGWYAHSDKVNADAAKKAKAAQAKAAVLDDSAEQAKTITETRYRTITKQVVKYVQDPNRTLCTFDYESVRLRQSAIDAANAISINDAGAVQTGVSGQ